LYFRDPVPQFLLHLLHNTLLGFFAVEFAGARLHGSFTAILQKYRQAQLSREQHGLAVGIAGKNDGRVAIVVNLALAPLSLTVAPALFVCHADQLALVLSYRLDVVNAHGLTVHFVGLQPVIRLAVSLRLKPERASILCVGSNYGGRQWFETRILTP
jgi:hypothetical protein